MATHEWTQPDGRRFEVVPRDGSLYLYELGGVVPTRIEECAVTGREILRLSHPLTPFERISADRLADEVASLVTRHLLDSRSAAADALLDYREPPRTPRSDRIAALEAEVEAARERERELREALGAACDVIDRQAERLYGYIPEAVRVEQEDARALLKEE